MKSATRISPIRAVGIAAAVAALGCGGLSAPAAAVPTITVTAAIDTAVPAHVASNSGAPARYGATRRPVVKSVTPSRGPTVGGNRVVIKGSKFARVRWVKFGTAKATHVRVKTRRKIVVHAPAHAAGVVYVKVRTRAGKSRPHVTYRFVAPPPPPIDPAQLPAPTVSAVSPSSGSTDGGTAITVTGTNFVDVTEVTVGDTTGTGMVVNSSTSLTVVTPAHAAGAVDVRVVSTHGTSATSASDRFTYTAPGPEPLTWGSPTLVDRLRGEPTSVSCPTTTFCMAVDFYGNALTFNGTSWSEPVTVSTEMNPASVSCPTTTFCATVGGPSVAMFNGGNWDQPEEIDPITALTSISCVSSMFCVAVDQFGQELRFNGTSWTDGVQIDPVAAFTSVSCVTTSFCVAVNDGGKATIFDGTTWSTPMQVDEHGDLGFPELRAVSCASITFCVAVDDIGRALTFDGDAWSGPVAAGSDALGSVSCVSSTFCMAGGVDGNVVTFNGATWSEPTLVAGGRALNLSCAAASFCVAVDSDGFAYVFADGTWESYQADLPDGGLSAVSCASASFCATVNSMRDAATYNGAAWSSPAMIVDHFHVLTGHVSCPTAVFCAALAGDEGGPYVVAFNGTSWAEPEGLGDESLYDISCPTASFCLAVGAGVMGTFDGATWTIASIPDDSDLLTDVSCASATFCVAVDWVGNALTYDGTSWSTPVNLVPYDEDAESLQDVSCSSTSFCIAVDGAGNAYGFNGSSWSEPTAITSTGISAVSCPSATFCAAADLDSNVVEFNGGMWADPQRVGIPLTDISCPTDDFCVGVSQDGYSVVGH